MDQTMELVKEMFAPKPRPTLDDGSNASLGFSIQPSSSSYLSSSMPADGEGEEVVAHGCSSSGDSLCSTATADSSVASASAASHNHVNNNDNDNHIADETTTLPTPPTPPTPIAIPLRPSKTLGKNTRSSSCPVPSFSHEEQINHQHNQGQNNNNSNNYYRRSNSSSDYLYNNNNNNNHHFSVPAATPAPVAFYSNNGARNFSRNNAEHHHSNNNDDDQDENDILGRLMSHDVTAQWMLKNHHHDGNSKNGGVDGAAGWPMICVVGDTSSGKSSLLCNLSGIELPTNHQLTTRCPILLHIARRQRRKQQPRQENTTITATTRTTDITKTATIQIQWRSKLPAQKQQQQQQQWKERTCTDANWQEIPRTILDAQEFILQQTGKQVAPDIVRVDVVYYNNDNDDNHDKNAKGYDDGGSGGIREKDNDDDHEDDNAQQQQQQHEHEYPYLTLLDLPGLVQTSAADESPTLVHEIQFLVRSYLQSPQTLILAVLSCTTDFHNAQVLAEILHYNNNNNNNHDNNNNNNLAGRTIPVLTKPDLMDPGAAEVALRDDLLLGGKQLLPTTPAVTTLTAANAGIHSSWSDDLATATTPSNSNNNQNDTNNNGNNSNSNPFTFHMVKGRGQAALDRGDSIEQGLQDEAHFFETREPWKSVTNRTLFGTRHLQVKLAQLQHNVVRQTTLPRLYRDIQERRHALQMELQDLLGGSCSISDNMEVDAESGMPLAVMLETPADRRRYYQQVCQTLVASLQASLSGKKQRMTTTSSRTTPTRSTRLVYRKQLQQFNSCMSSTSSQDDTTTCTTSSSAVMTASAQLHEACNQFCQAVRQGSLATIKSVVEGAQVLVTAPSPCTNNSRSLSGSSGGAVRQVRGEVVHLDETFACVDYIDPVDAQSDILFYSTRSTMFNNTAVEDVIEENDVWSDGNHVYIARRDGVFDTLHKIPLDRIRTDPSWLKEKIEQNRTDDLGCFLNADIFQSIVADFIDEDWRPSCLALLDRMREILRDTVKRVVQETTGGGASSSSSSSSASRRWGSSSTRYPGLQRWLVQQCRKVAEDLIQQAYQQVESHLMLEKQHPYTQDHNLFQNMAQARHANLKRELEVALRLDPQPQQQQSSSSPVKLSNHNGKTTSVMNTSRGAIQNILDEVFERHSKQSVEDHMAEEMEIVLEAYGSIATRRVMDRTPMICWQVYRSITAAMQDALYCNVTDEILENHILRQAPDFEKRYNQLTQELKEWNEALQIVESVM